MMTKDLVHQKYFWVLHGIAVGFYSTKIQIIFC